MNLLIPPTNAQAAAPSAAGFDFMSLLPLVLIFAVFYFLLIRPQQKKAQQQKALLSALKRGDRIITNGGLIGVISKIVSDQELQVEIAEGVRVRIARPMVADVLSRTEPVPGFAEESSAVENKPKPKAKAPQKSAPVRKKK
ncbi:MAG: preprotein translocase subunit YajC [Proteobacteria bacterium]|nr:preprotein translocase subunit YajC [Pseudomonadota bacterium]